MGEMHDRQTQWVDGKSLTGRTAGAGMHQHSTHVAAPARTLLLVLSTLSDKSVNDRHGLDCQNGSRSTLLDH